MYKYKSIFTGFFLFLLYVGLHRVCVCVCVTRGQCQVPLSTASHLVLETGSLTGSLTLTDQRVPEIILPSTPPLGYKHKSLSLASCGC